MKTGPHPQMGPRLSDYLDAVRADSDSYSHCCLPPCVNAQLWQNCERLPGLL